MEEIEKEKIAVKKEKKKKKKLHSENRPLSDFLPISSHKSEDIESENEKIYGCDQTKKNAFKKIYNCLSKRQCKEIPSTSSKSSIKTEKPLEVKIERKKSSKKHKKKDNKKKKQESSADELETPLKKMEPMLLLTEADILVKKSLNKKIKLKNELIKQEKNADKGLEDTLILWELQNASAVPSPTQKKWEEDVDEEDKNTNEMQQDIMLSQNTSSLNTISCEKSEIKLTVEDTTKKEVQEHKDTFQGQNEIPTVRDTKEIDKKEINCETSQQINLNEEIISEKVKIEVISSDSEQENEENGLQNNHAPALNIPRIIELLSTPWHPEPFLGTVDEESIKELMKDSPDLCTDHMMGVCIRTQCKYRHAYTLADLKKTLHFCNDFVNKGCHYPACVYLHASLREENIFKKTGKLPNVLIQKHFHSARMRAGLESNFTALPTPDQHPISHPFSRLFPRPLQYPHPPLHPHPYPLQHPHRHRLQHPPLHPHPHPYRHPHQYPLQHPPQHLHPLQRPHPLQHPHSLQYQPQRPPQHLPPHQPQHPPQHPPQHSPQHPFSHPFPHPPQYPATHPLPHQPPHPLPYQPPHPFPHPPQNQPINQLPHIPQDLPSHQPQHPPLPPPPPPPPPPANRNSSNQQSHGPFASKGNNFHGNPAVAPDAIDTKYHNIGPNLKKVQYSTSNTFPNPNLSERINLNDKLRATNVSNLQKYPNKYCIKASSDTNSLPVQTISSASSFSSPQNNPNLQIHPNVNNSAPASEQYNTSHTHSMQYPPFPPSQINNHNQNSSNNNSFDRQTNIQYNTFQSPLPNNLNHSTLKTSPIESPLSERIKFNNSLDSQSTEKCYNNQYNNGSNDLPHIIEPSTISYCLTSNQTQFSQPKPSNNFHNIQNVKDPNSSYDNAARDFVQQQTVSQQLNGPLVFNSQPQDTKETIISENKLNNNEKVFTFQCSSGDFSTVKLEINKNNTCTFKF